MHDAAFFAVVQLAHAEPPMTTEGRQLSDCAYVQNVGLRVLMDHK